MSKFFAWAAAAMIIAGYIANIVKLFGETTVGWIAGRTIGIFLPTVGVIAGYF